MRYLQILALIYLSGPILGQVDCTECLRNLDALIEKKRQLEVDRDFYKREMEKLEQKPEKRVVKTKYIKVADPEQVNHLTWRINQFVLDSANTAQIIKDQGSREIDLRRESELLRYQRTKDSLVIDSLHMLINNMLKHSGNKIDERKRSVYYAGNVYDYSQVFEFVEFYRNGGGQYFFSLQGKRKLRWISQLILLELGPKSKLKLRLTVQIPVGIQPHHPSYIGGQELQAKIQSYLRSIGCPETRISLNTLVERSTVVNPRVMFSLQQR